MLNTRLLKNIDWIFMVSLLAIILVSLVVLRSASANVFDDSYYFVKRQLLWAVVGLFLMFLISTFDYSFLARFGNYIYVGNIILLLAVFVIGYESKGAQRWISLGLFDLQPSELAKIAIIISFAAFLVKRQERLDSIWDLIPCFVYVGIPFLLILRQPDLGTSLVFLAILMGMLWIGELIPKLLSSSCSLLFF